MVHGVAVISAQHWSATCPDIWAPPMNGDQDSVRPLSSETATSGVQHSATTSGVQYSADTPGSVDGTEGAHTSGVQDSATGNILCEKIKYDVPDFLASCVRLRKELTDTHDVPFKPALTPFWMRLEMITD
jgi:hypothetical protein